MHRALVVFTAALTLVVVVVGAYVRLEDAGLGCPDWPGCFGHIVGVPDHPDEVEAAQRAFPGKTVDPGRARKEMLHRYLAGTLGLLIAAIAVIAWRRRLRGGAGAALETATVAVVVFQAILGMWTVTMLLKPAIVTLHLLGGMTTLALMTWLALRALAPAALPRPAPRGLRALAVAALAVLAVQIALGGWVSANYAALACMDFPTCHGRWMPELDFPAAFHVVRELGVGPEGAPLSQAALNAIQWSHRTGAVLAALALGALGVCALRTRGLRALGAALGALLLVQLALGAANVLLRLPLVLAAAHNAVAALLLVTLVMINFAVFRRSNPAP